MRDSVVTIRGLLLIAGCASQPAMFVHPTRNAVEQQQDLADCTARAEQQPLRYPNPKQKANLARSSRALRTVRGLVALR